MLPWENLACLYAECENERAMTALRVWSKERVSFFSYRESLLSTFLARLRSSDFVPPLP